MSEDIDLYEVVTGYSREFMESDWRVTEASPSVVERANLMAPVFSFLYSELIESQFYIIT